MRFDAKTHETHTVDWIASRRKFMEKCEPLTTNCERKVQVSTCGCCRSTARASSWAAARLDGQRRRRDHVQRSADPSRADPSRVHLNAVLETHLVDDSHADAGDAVAEHGQRWVRREAGGGWTCLAAG